MPGPGRHAAAAGPALDSHTAAIKSLAGLQRYERQTDPGLNPLNALTPLNRRLFIDKLTFNEKGLSSFSYAALAGLSASQVYRILGLFGVQTDIGLIRELRIRRPEDQAILQAAPARSPTEHLDYWCSGRATCAQQVGTICTGNC